MGKRSDFERLERDYYKTPLEAVRPLLPHLDPRTRFAEPCAGDGQLIDHLTSIGHECVWACDIQPERADILQGDATTCELYDFSDGEIDCFITNSPWDRSILHPIIVNLSDQAPTWLLFDADWKHTLQSAPFMSRCRKIVSVGRVKWFPDTKMTGKDNCAWYLFDRPSFEPPLFFGRGAVRNPIMELIG